MTERTTNAQIAAQLASIETQLKHLTATVGEGPDDGLRGEVKMLVGVKNKGWGLVVGLLLLAGGIGAALKAVFADLLK
ncbi:hypothetical protein [uncultured Brevundimonas sp.]|uniref:hypothetical protein n=1 Tax=uncultured Brevundimonas sp. TaxID=213418 RepID=UPI002613FE06|nr:hypothetical protein [uncultured Brevundimonas sp.]